MDNLTKNEIEIINDSLLSEMIELNNYNRKYKNHPDLNKFLNKIETLEKIRNKLNPTIKYL